MNFGCSLVTIRWHSYPEVQMNFWAFNTWNPIYISPCRKIVCTSYSVHAVVIFSKSLIPINSKMTTQACLIPNKQVPVCKYEAFLAWFTSQCCFKFYLILHFYLWNILVVKFVFVHFILNMGMSERQIQERRKEGHVPANIVAPALPVINHIFQSHSTFAMWIHCILFVTVLGNQFVIDRRPVTDRFDCTKYKYSDTSTNANDIII